MTIIAIIYVKISINLVELLALNPILATNVQQQLHILGNQQNFLNLIPDTGRLTKTHDKHMYSKHVAGIAR